MMPEEEPEEELDLSSLWLTLQDFEDGTLTMERHDQLMAQLERSPAARRAYFEYFQQSAIFKMEGAKMHELGLLPVVDERPYSKKLVKYSLITAGLAVAVIALVATFININPPPPPRLSADVAAGTRWAVDGKLQNPNSTNLTVMEGSQVEVLSGTLKLQIASGATMVMQGPAKVFFPKLEQPKIENGWLWIESAGQEEPFEVSTADFLIRDIGTRFGVGVTGDQLTEVHLIEGKVEVYSKVSGQKIANLVPGKTGYQFSDSTPKIALPLKPDPFPKLADLLAAKQNFHTAILSQTPVGYWQLDEPTHQPLANTITTGPPATPGLDILPGEPGIGAADGFHGFHEENRAVRLGLGDEQRSTLIGLDAPHGISRQQGSVAFWIRRHPDNTQGGILWLAGFPIPNDTAPNASMIHTQLDPNGQIGLFIENGKFDVIISSTRRITDNRWHHLAASWGPESVTLYLDGNQVAQAQDFGKLQPGTSSGRFIRFGKPSRNLAQENRGFFNGWVDEISLWDRPLTPVEVLHQFQSAQGSAPPLPARKD